MDKKEKSRLKNGNNKSKQPDSNSSSQRFFNQKHIIPSSEMQGAQKTQQPQEISLQTTTDLLLAGILQELKTQNMIELMKLKTQQEQEQEELQAAKKMQEEDEARFKEIQYTMYT
ncbi:MULTISPECIES: hypothetical protein [Legionella]|uniref:Coiled-coil protein n=1 Tax=Legionella resiliens TaxID=2905958 RepID=A0ABS8WYZ4_9GAMM|nr:MULTISPECIES: hypothetical protein [unclassified Legionella]MCE0722531.1 hypothetical protein [Legionella sp. 9fVS26]MCE3531685.1 hypothetical protein [Legionella sp. 8cVS16]QLZ67707.1 hypothetical protein FOLKNPGA_00480 [Legionella sp. PC1000]